VHITYQPDTKSNPNPKLTTKENAIVNIQLNSHISYVPYVFAPSLAVLTLTLTLTFLFSCLYQDTIT